jgi:hypothetical protein
LLSRVDAETRGVRNRGKRGGHGEGDRGEARKATTAKKIKPRKVTGTEATGAAAVVPGHRVVVFVQDNETTDFYFPTLAGWGAAVADHGNLLTAPPTFGQPHDRNAWVHFVMGDYPALDPPFVGTHPTWNIPSIFSVAQAAGVSWATFPDGSGAPHHVPPRVACSKAGDQLLTSRPQQSAGQRMLASAGGSCPPT